MGRWKAAGVTVIGGAAVVGLLMMRRWQLGWGTTGQEAGVPLPGDGLIANPGLTATRGITIGAPAGQVWPWIAQLGQGAGRILQLRLPRKLGWLRHPQCGSDQVRVAGGGGRRPGPARSAGRSRRGFGGAGEVSCAARRRPGGEHPAPYDFTWAFVLNDAPGGATRLLVRERYAYTRPWARALVEPVEAVSFVMSQKMLRGIRDRAERSAAQPDST
jgi:hypothetical protein